MRTVSKYSLISAAIMLIIVLPIFYKNTADPITQNICITIACLCVVVIILSGLFLAVTDGTKSIPVEPEVKKVVSKSPITTPEYNTPEMLPEPVPNYLTPFNYSDYHAISRVSVDRSFDIITDHYKQQMTKKQYESFVVMTQVAKPIVVETQNGRVLDALWPQGERSRVPELEAQLWFYLLNKTPLK